MSLSNNVFPTPLGPVTNKRSPALMLKVISWNNARSPSMRLKEMTSKLKSNILNINQIVGTASSRI